MMVGPSVVTGRAVAGGELGGDARHGQGLEGLVDGRQADRRDGRADLLADLLGRRVPIRAAQRAVDRCALAGEIATGRLEGGPGGTFVEKWRRPPRGAPPGAPRGGGPWKNKRQRRSAAV